MNRHAFYHVLTLFVAVTTCSAQEEKPIDAELARLQGLWTRQIRNADGVAITITKEVKGKREWLRAAKGDEILQEHVVDFEITKTNSSLIFTYRNLVVTEGPNRGAEQKRPVSYHYRISDNEWICVHGLFPQDKKPFQVEAYKRAKEATDTPEPSL